jgi:hypothetical protein
LGTPLYTLWSFIFHLKELFKNVFGSKNVTALFCHITLPSTSLNMSLHSALSQWKELILKQTSGTALLHLQSADLARAQAFWKLVCIVCLIKKIKKTLASKIEL